MKCKDCGKYPFCEYTNNGKQEACISFIKREVTQEIKKKEDNNV